MTKQFEIFTTESLMDTKTSAIDALFGYPDAPTKTTTYRDGIKQYNGTQWAACVCEDLVEACSSMTPEERAIYYNDSDLKSYQWLVDNNWFPPYEL